MTFPAADAHAPAQISRARQKFSKSKGPKMNPLSLLLLLQAIGEEVAPSALCLLLLAGGRSASRRFQACLQADCGLLFEILLCSSHGFAGRIVSDRDGNLHRDREWWTYQVGSLSESDFRAFYKVSTNGFRIYKNNRMHYLCNIEEGNSARGDGFRRSPRMSHVRTFSSCWVPFLEDAQTR